MPTEDFVRSRDGVARSSSEGLAYRRPCCITPADVPRLMGGFSPLPYPVAADLTLRLLNPTPPCQRRVSFARLQEDISENCGVRDSCRTFSVLSANSET
jgi:hypothetical protein